jgi:phosphatidylserine decarboxylase
MCFFVMFFSEGITMLSRDTINRFAAQVKNSWLSVIMPALPKEDMSSGLGQIARLTLPLPMRAHVLRLFAQASGINIDEAAKSLHEYQSISEFFSRQLKPECRPLGAGFVHCADARITQAGSITAGTLLQAKNRAYSVEHLLRNTTWAEMFSGGFYITYYLSPADYHRVHSPTDADILWSSHIPGKLWPVNEWGISNVEGVLTHNERLAWVMKGRDGTHYAMVMVGATNVGSISVTFDLALKSGDYRTERALREKSYPSPIPVAAGAELGTFHLGSTVVVLTQESAGWSLPILERLPDQRVRVRSSVFISKYESPQPAL